MTEFIQKLSRNRKRSRWGQRCFKIQKWKTERKVLSLA